MTMTWEIVCFTITLLLLHPEGVFTNSRLNSDALTPYGPYEQQGELSQIDNTEEIVQDERDTSVNQLSLTDILNHRVNEESEMCSRRNSMMFFITGDVRFLRECVQSRNDSSQRMVQGNTYGGEGQQEPTGSNTINSYSGRLLKRILENIGQGTAKVDFPRPSPDARTQNKRSRLSVNGAMSSLVDMLRHESMGSPRQMSAFHRDLLHMG